MKRRWIHSIPASKAWRGEYATKWDGWEKAWIRNVVKEKFPRWILTSISILKRDDFKSYIPDYCGVYVFINRNDYVLYVGRSKKLGYEILQRFRSFDKYKRKYIRKFAAHRSYNMPQAKNMEMDLLRYYTPPWDTKYHK